MEYMQYPLISEYREAILSAGDNLDQLQHLRPVLDAKGDPVMSSGNFAVVFRMTDGAKDYALKCFLREQEGRGEAYRKICEYLPRVPSPYLVKTQYMERELFVDTHQTDEEEFPVLVMDWVEGESLERYVRSIRGDAAGRERLADEFRGLALWLLNQEFAHGDLKPDNIIVTEGGHLVLVDYDGMYVPSMRGERARELGTPLYRYRGRKEEDFDEYADDYACAFIMLVLMAGSVAPMDFDGFGSPEAKEVVRHFEAYMEDARVAPYLAAFMLTASCGRLDRQVLYPLLSRRTPMLWQASAGQPLAVGAVGALQRQGSRMVAVRQVLRFAVKGVSFEMVPVAGGTFMMGAADDNAEAGDREKPAHKVTLSSYYIGETEVTQELWEAVMGSNPSWFAYNEDNLPVENVSWNDCQEFIGKLNRLTGKQFRLPTEAEWEYAARGGNQSKGYKYSGSNDIDEVAWYAGNSGGNIHPVGTKQPNELGLYDMSGNVWEWCADWYGSYSSGAQTDPTGPRSGSIRVYRGGGWWRGASICRSSYRDYCSPDCRYYLGLRLALSE